MVLLRGVNVGGRRRLRPATLASQLKHLGAVNIGATGTFVIRGPVGRARVRAEFAQRLAFETEIVICNGRDFVGFAKGIGFAKGTGIVARDDFAARRARPGVVRFVSVLARAPRRSPPLPLRFPARGPWLVRVVARDRRFVFGFYRRHMKVIGYLGELDRIFGVPATTRGWRTIEAIARALGHDS